MIHVDIRTITVGHVHAEPGEPHKVAKLHKWLMENPEADLPPLDVRAKPNGTYRIHDGRHRFLAYVLAERPVIPIVIGRSVAQCEAARMPSGPEVDLHELREALSRVLDAAEARLGDTVDLDADFYWTLDPRHAFELDQPPAEGLTAGQLSDDIAEMKRIAAGADDAVIWHDLAHIVGILGRIAALDLPGEGSR